MSVFWYAFNFKDYASDTARLSCEAHGAYIQLIADYYNSGEGPPDDDFILAAITKLPVEQWQTHRRVLERFFEIRDGHWFHERIEREMRDALLKHTASKERASAAAHAMHASRRAKEAGTAETKPKRSRSTAAHQDALPQAVHRAMPEQEPEQRQLQSHPLITGGGEAPPEAIDVELQVGPIPRDFTPDPSTSDRAKAAGMTVAEIDVEVRKFIIKRQGQLSDDWQGSFALWIEREIAHRAKQATPKAPPRIEVNNVPTADDFDRALRLFVTGGKWSRQLGPEPGQLGCKVPPALIEKHGLDPKTGLRKAS